MSIGVAADMWLDHIVFDGLPPLCPSRVRFMTGRTVRTAATPSPLLTKTEVSDGNPR